MSDNGPNLVLRGEQLVTDENGNVCLNDLWRLGGEDDNRSAVFKNSANFAQFIGRGNPGALLQQGARTGSAHIRESLLSLSLEWT